MDRAGLRDLDLRHVWHPYTQMADFAASDFPIIERAEGCRLVDVDGTQYWDGTASMWLNVHGHRSPAIDQAIRQQLDKVAHATLLGQASVPATKLSAALARSSGLPRVFLSDNGSTAVESAIKMAVQFHHQRGHASRRLLASFDGAYHGDTLGAVAAAPVPAFHSAFSRILPAPPVRLPWPDATRGPHPGDPDATRDWALEQADTTLRRHRHELAAVLVESHAQVVGGMRVMPPGYLRGLRDLVHDAGALLILDEVATGLGRTGRMFAYEHDDARPDLAALGKGLTGGYLPLAATLATDDIHDAFLGTYEEAKAFYHGHSYAGNAIGCAAALANLELLDGLLPTLAEKETWMRSRLATMSSIPHVGEIRQAGFLVGFDLVRDRTTMEPFAWQSRAAWSVYLAAKRRGLLARPYASIGLFVPPLAATRAELAAMLDIYEAALHDAQPDLRRLAQERWPDLAEVPA